MTPAARAVLVEAGITIGTGVALWALLQYGPGAIDSAVAAWKGWNAPTLAAAVDELAVSDFRAGLSGTPVPDRLAAENWGW